MLVHRRLALDARGLSRAVGTEHVNNKRVSFSSESAIRLMSAVHTAQAASSAASASPPLPSQTPTRIMIHVPSAETQVAKRGRPPDDAVLKASKKLRRAQEAYKDAHLKLFEKRDAIFSEGALYDAPSIVERTKERFEAAVQHVAALEEACEESRNELEEARLRQVQDVADSWKRAAVASGKAIEAMQQRHELVAVQLAEVQAELDFEVKMQVREQIEAGGKALREQWRKDLWLRGVL